LREFRPAYAARSRFRIASKENFWRDIALSAMFFPIEKLGLTKKDLGNPPSIDTVGER
jgi:hypothetical protein